MMTMPKFNLLYYKNILDIAFQLFFDENNNKFKKQGNCYILAEAMSISQLKNQFKKHIANVIKKYAQPYSIETPNYWLVIGACMPKDNMLLQCKGSQYFPAKLQKMIDADWQIKWLLKEKDIKIDNIKFNDACIQVFNKLFSDKNQVLRLLGKEWTNVLFVQHKCLDCYSMFKTIKAIYGRSNCINIWKEKMQDVKLPLVALNDLIDKYIHNKADMNKLPQFKIAMQEVKQFIDENLLHLPV